MPTVARMAKPSAWNSSATGSASSRSRSATVMSTVPSRGKHLLRRLLRLGEGEAERVGHAQHLAGGAHLRPQERVDLREHVEGEHGLLDPEVAGWACVSSPRSASLVPSINCVARRAIWMLQTLETSGTVREARGLASST